VWFPWSGWVEDGWYVSHNTYHDDPERYSVSQRRSWAGGGWRVSGGWWAADFGGGGGAQFGSLGGNIPNAFGGAGDFGYGAIRGPVRVDAAGSLEITTVAPAGGDRSTGGVGQAGLGTCRLPRRRPPHVGPSLLEISHTL